MAHNVLAVYDVFLCPIKRNCVAVLRAQKNVAERKTHKGRSPTGFFRSLDAERWRTVTVLLGDGYAYSNLPVLIINGGCPVLVSDGGTIYQEVIFIG
jgi:hypothetical protein